MWDLSLGAQLFWLQNDHIVHGVIRPKLFWLQNRSFIQCDSDMLVNHNHLLQNRWCKSIRLTCILVNSYCRFRDRIDTSPSQPNNLTLDTVLPFSNQNSYVYLTCLSWFDLLSLSYITTFWFFSRKYINYHENSTTLPPIFLNAMDFSPAIQIGFEGRIKIPESGASQGRKWCPIV